jgi:eukaryotic-like serine/threonine-protein kinase
MPLAAGTRLGPYEVLGLIGAGGMGEVYKARDTRLDRLVALKLLSAELSGGAVGRARFEREARAVASLAHPHICTLYDIGMHPATGAGQPTLYLVMEHLEGETLADRLTRGPLPLTQAIDIAVQMAEALAVAHQRGIVHRDLKPGNVMLSGSRDPPCASQEARGTLRDGFRDGGGAPFAAPDRGHR